MEIYAETAMSILDELHTERLDYHSEYLPLADAINRLESYEETGLGPEEIMEAVKLFSGTNADVPKEIIGWVERATWHCKRLAELTRLVSFDRLRELAQADREEEHESNV